MTQITTKDEKTQLKSYYEQYTIALLNLI